MKIREATKTDIGSWSKLRTALWPNSDDEHISEINDFFSGDSIDIEKAYVVEVEGDIVGFMELNLRSFAEGSRKPVVPYVEAWYIVPEHQGKGYGSLLMNFAEKWALSLGYNELASDTEIENERSISMHAHLGFKEVERVVCFLKQLGNK